VFPSSRPTAIRLKRQIIRAAGICAALLGFSAVPALAAPAAQAPAACEGQTFSQAFAAFNDPNYYTPVPGGEFNSPSEGWGLSNGAQVVEAERPDGSTGGALDMPSGSVAVSPPVCVTLQYPTARAWVRNVEGSEGIAVAVAYVNSKSEDKPHNVGQVHGQQSQWTLSNPFNVRPKIAGHEEETREVRFVFVAGGKASDFQLFGPQVDPRMR
jgi:hypothetical protein